MRPEYTRDYYLYWREKFPNREEWWHPEAESDAKADFFTGCVAVSITEASPRDFRRATYINLPPDKARLLAQKIIDAAALVETTNYERKVPRHKM